jgi:hypothetical protein
VTDTHGLSRKEYVTDLLENGGTLEMGTEPWAWANELLSRETFDLYAGKGRIQRDHAGRRCPSCGGSVATENYGEATITSGECGYSEAAHWGGGELQRRPCRKPAASRSAA